MPFLSMIALISSLLTATVVFLIGRFLVRLRFTTISVAKGSIDEYSESEREGATDSNTRPLESPTSDENKKWTDYTIKLSFAESLSTIGYLLMVIAILIALSALIVWGMRSSAMKDVASG